MCNIEENKKELREKYIKLRNSINCKESKSDVIFYKIIELDEFKFAKVIAIYKSLKSEVNTQKIIDYCLKKGKTVVLPKVEKSIIKFYKIDSLQDRFVKSSFGVKEPITNLDNFIESDKIDLVIVPGLCFDKNKNRLGFGKGYYDRFLNGTKIKSIAICFEEQILKDNELPTNNYDVAVDIIVTDKRITQ